MSTNVLDVITEVIMTKKMIFVQYCPNDMWTGCSTLTGKAELAYRRICDLIYVQDNKLFDDEVTWEQVTRPFYEDIAKKSKLNSSIKTKSILMKAKSVTRDVT
jgi:hypothetical protein